jgi:alkanesulfonate monooxygenase SsuD/methylene tetrahydromethanopterin reductase-like flavin-dependent oxidoreductase (luciferase family)
VLVLPWHDPVLLAERAATLDLLSGGRLDFGVGKGYRHSEFAGFCVTPQEAEARFDESLAVILQAWSADQPFSHEGRFWHYHEIVVEPPTAQKPHPPVWIAAGNPEAVRKVAAVGANLLLDQFASTEAIGAGTAGSRRPICADQRRRSQAEHAAFRRRGDAGVPVWLHGQRRTPRTSLSLRCAPAGRASRAARRPGTSSAR